MEIYNGEYEQCQEVIIKAEYHDVCPDIAKKIRHLCKAWSHNVRYDEYKSAGKGDVLKRDILIYQTAYAHDIITFRESLRCICHYYDLFSKADITLTDRQTIPTDIGRNLVK